MRQIIFLVIVFLPSGIMKAQPTLEGLPADYFEVTWKTPVQQKKLAKKHYFFDFGKAGFGTVELTSSRPITDTLILHLGEKLNKKGTIDRNPGGTIRYQKVQISGVKKGQPYLVELPPDKRNTNKHAVALPDSFGVIMPFRYCEIENMGIAPEQLKVRQKMFHVRFDDEESFFNSDDTILNQVWDICKYSIKATSFAGVYVDGDRERIPYEADAFINQLSHYCVDDNYQMARHTNTYFLNNPTWPTEWILHTVPLFYYDYLYTGNIDSVRKYYHVLKAKTLRDLVDEKGLISSEDELVDGAYMQKIGFKDTSRRIRDIVDWPPGQDDTKWNLAREKGERDGYDMSVKINTVVNAFFYRNMVLMEKLAIALGEEEDARVFRKQARQTKSAINKHLFDPQRMVYVDGMGSNHASLHANMFPLAFNLVPSGYVDGVIDFVKSRGMACSVYGAQYLLEGLYKYHQDEYALELMTSKTDRSWWNMIRIGSTITLEAWGPKHKPNLDWNHAWGAAPANIIVRYTWGIRPLEPGFDTAVIEPQMGQLERSSVKAPTPKGAIHGTFNKERGKMVFSFTIPQGVMAFFKYPVTEDAELLLNGQTFRPDKKKGTLLKTGENQIIIRK